MTMQAEIRDGQYTVTDSDGGVWWPNEDAQKEIQDADAPEDAALALCLVHPMSGVWKQ